MKFGKILVNRLMIGGALSRFMLKIGISAERRVQDDALVEIINQTGVRRTILVAVQIAAARAQRSCDGILAGEGRGRTAHRHETVKSYR
jgi:hypothetical protein